SRARYRPRSSPPAATDPNSTRPTPNIAESRYPKDRLRTYGGAYWANGAVQIDDSRSSPFGGSEGGALRNEDAAICWRTVGSAESAASNPPHAAPPARIPTGVRIISAPSATHRGRRAFRRECEGPAVSTRPEVARSSAGSDRCKKATMPADTKNSARPATVR